MKNINVEAEGGEILLQSKEGHYAIIPAKDRGKIKKMIINKCEDCINNYIQTLPKDSDYAEDGTVFSNPPKKVKVQHPDGTVKEYNTTDKEYKQVYNTAKSWYYDKEKDTYGYSNVPEVTVTTKKNNIINDNLLKGVTPNMDLQEYYTNQRINKTDAISNLGDKQQVDAKIFRNQQYQDLENLDDNDFSDKYQTSKHRFKYDKDETYKKQVDENIKILTKQSGGIDYPNTDMRSKSYTGNPNLAFMNPNKLTGKSAADNEQFHMDLIGSALPIPGINQVGKIKGLENLVSKGSEVTNNIVNTARNINSFSNADEFYRVVHGDDAIKDLFESGLVRSKAANKTNVVDEFKPTSIDDLFNSNKKVIDLTNRPTDYPSFSKGKVSIQYAQNNPNNYIITTKNNTIKPSTKGRHGKGTTMFPTDELGNPVHSLDAKEVQVFKHIGNDEYELIYDMGKIIKPLTKK